MGAATCGELLVHDCDFIYHRHPDIHYIHYGFVLTLLINGITNILEYCNELVTLILTTKILIIYDRL